jgi:hypothetical protein
MPSHAVAADDQALPDARNLPYDLVFDDAYHEAYWSGHRLTSPVRFVRDSAGLAVDGLAQSADTSGFAARELRLQRTLGSIPFIRNARAEGLSFYESANRLGAAKIRELEQLSAAHHDSSRRGTQLSANIAGRLVDTTVVDPSVPIRVDSTGVTLAFRGEPLRRHPLLPAQDIRTESSRDSSVEASRQRQLETIASHLESRRTPVLIVANPGGLIVFSGDRAAAARAEIAGALATGQFPPPGTTHLVPRGYLREILAAARAQGH